MTLAVHQFTVTDGAGNVVPGAHVEVRREVPGQPLAVLKEDRAGVIALSNPFDADENGFVRFYVVGGSYKIRVYTGPSGAPTFEAEPRRHVAIGLNSESDSIAQRTEAEITAAGVYVMSPDDPDCLVINKTVAAPNTVTLCDSALRGGRPVTIIDGKGDANTNNITYGVPSGKKLYGVLNGTGVIDGNGGSVELKPRADGSGWN